MTSRTTISSALIASLSRFTEILLNTFLLIELQSRVDLMKCPVAFSNSFIKLFLEILASTQIQSEMSHVNGNLQIAAQPYPEENQQQFHERSSSRHIKGHSPSCIRKHQQHRAIVLPDIQLIFIHGLSAHNKGSGFSRLHVDPLFSLESERKRDGTSKTQSTDRQNGTTMTDTEGSFTNKKKKHYRELTDGKSWERSQCRRQKWKNQ